MDDTEKIIPQEKPEEGSYGLQQGSESSNSCSSTAVFTVETDNLGHDHDSISDQRETANLLVNGGGGGDQLTVVVNDSLKVPLNDCENSPPPTTQRSKSYGFGSIASLNEQPQKSYSESGSTSKAEFLRDTQYKPPCWGWVVVLAAWIIMIPIAGTLASFGVFVGPLTDEFNSTKLVTGWVGSLSFGFTVGVCPISTALFSVFGARKVASVGVFMVITGAIVSSFANSIYMLFASYSLLLGTGANFVYNTVMNLVGQYFPSKHQALATCLATAGISTGTLALNPVADLLVTQFGWRWTWRIMSAWVLVIGVLCIATLRPAPGSQQQDPSGEQQIRHSSTNKDDADDVQVYTGSRLSLAAQEIKRNAIETHQGWSISMCCNFGLILWLIGTLFWSISFLFPHIFLTDYMTTIGIDSSTSSLVMLVYGCAELCGRFLCAIFAGRIRFSLAYIYSICSLIAGTVCLITPSIQTLQWMFLYGISAGVNSGILNALMFVTTMQLFGNESGKYIWGYINVMLALGMVIGPIMAGGIYDATQSYSYAFYVGGGVFLACGVVMTLIKPSLSRWPLKTNEPSVAVKEKKNPIYRKKLLERPGGGRLSSSGSLSGSVSGQRDSKWNRDVDLHLKTLTAIDEEVKQLQQDD